jgi:hypothetical protein
VPETPEIPDHLAKVLAELEARKQSLRSRLEVLDSAISGIQTLHGPTGEISPEAVLLQLDQLESAERLLSAETVLQEGAVSPSEVLSGVIPERESPEQNHTITPAKVPATVSKTEPESRRAFILVNEGSHTPVPKTQALTRPIPKPDPERRKPPQLNVYVNRNADWASAQLLAPQSPRAVFRHKTGQRCPSCGSQDTRLSLTRGLADFFMFLFDYSIARCRNCNCRFRIWRARPEEESTELEAQPSAK